MVQCLSILLKGRMNNNNNNDKSLMSFSFPCRLLRIIHPASSCETCQLLEFSLNGLQA